MHIHVGSCCLHPLTQLLLRKDMELSVVPGARIHDATVGLMVWIMVSSR